MASNVRVFANNGGLRSDAVTLADVFKQAGYKTAWFGKTHEIQPGNNDGARTDNEGRRSRLPEDAAVVSRPVSAEVDRLAQLQAISFLRDYREKPFFAGVSFIKPHFPFLVQEKYYQLDREIIDFPPVSESMIAELPQMSKEEREKCARSTLSTDAHV
jgi:arylsulfatase A-like enzyme